jgi:hypothetical protein
MYNAIMLPRKLADSASLLPYPVTAAMASIQGVAPGPYFVTIDVDPGGQL